MENQGALQQSAYVEPEEEASLPTLEPITNQTPRPRIGGKFLFVGNEKFWVKGVSYGAFRPDEEGNEYTDNEKLERDFAQMAASGVNTVRIPHTMPPRSLLDIAAKHGLRVMVGLSAEQYAGYLVDKKADAPDVVELVRNKVREVAGHPALLCYAVGNEIQASLVRWIGRKKVERYIRSIYKAIKSVDPQGLVTYVNYPTTEYLDLSFLDLLAFNVYLESEDKLAAYLQKLQNLACDRPLLMSEVGLDCLRNGEEEQARSLDWQIRTAFAEGCVGIVVFSWTDEWYRAEAEVEDWAFGLTNRDRVAKPGLHAVSRAFEEAPFPAQMDWPMVTVVVCSYNGAATIRDTMEGFKTLDYPDYEVIVVNDGSTDDTAKIVGEYDVKLISTENRGLSNARNTGWQNAAGEIIAYIDDDAYPDPHWLQYLAYRFMTNDFVGVGGPNLAPPGDGPIAECVYNAPGGPVQVLLTDIEAEHIPGCNMAFKREALEAIEGFDGRYRAAGDDVDVCWRLQAKGWKIGFHAAAMDWHHRRNSIEMYWNQQKGYGKAEALLEEKWPEKYNTLGHTTWGGRMYGAGFTLPLGRRQRVYGGLMGGAPFQSIYEMAPATIWSLPLMPEWYLLVGFLGILSLLGPLWPPMLWILPVFLASVAIPVIQAGISASRATFLRDPALSREQKLKQWFLTTAMHLTQPLARLKGRVDHGLTIWRRGGDALLLLPWPKSFAIWTEKWEDPGNRPFQFTSELERKGCVFEYGGDFDDWDIEVSGGLLGGARMMMAVEDHGGGAHYIRVRFWPKLRTSVFFISGLLLLLSLFAALDQAWLATCVLAISGLAVLIRSIRECASAQGLLAVTFERFKATLLVDPE
ncbi:glycosyltransferase [Haliea sp. E17]|uniref:glycosyltransferase n=1 Tax=Haliea sp. E17 TaxID=3401576 RepID=UPI003AABA51D